MSVGINKNGFIVCKIVNIYILHINCKSGTLELYDKQCKCLIEARSF